MLLVALLAGILSYASWGYAVPAAPNAGIVTAEVLAVQPPEKPGAPSLIRVKVISSEDVGGLPNFTKDKIGRTLELHTKKGVAKLKKGDAILVRVQFLGDEKGGLYWAMEFSRKEK